MISALTLVLFRRYRRRESLNNTLGAFGTHRNNDKPPMPDRASAISPSIPVALRSENQEPGLSADGYTNLVSTSRSFGDTISSNDSPQNKANLRQIELRRRMQVIQQEMADLERASMSQVASEPMNDADDLRANMEVLRGEVEMLKQAQHSQWAHGLSDDQVPAYTTFGNR